MPANGFLDACGFFPAAGGTGDFVVSAAVTGYQTPASAGAMDGAVYSYRAQSSDLSQWEIGFGAYATGTATLSRSTVVASSTGSKVNFSAPPSVYVTALSADLQNASLLNGLGSAATKDVGTAAGNVVQLDGSGKLPAVDASQVTGLGSSAKKNAGTGADNVLLLATANKLPALDGSALTGVIPPHGTDVGAYVFCYDARASGASPSFPGTTIAGSSLNPACTSDDLPASTLSGTWVLQGWTPGRGYLCLYKRIA